MTTETPTSVTGLFAEQLRLADRLANEPDRRDEILAECRSLAIGVLRPDINRSILDTYPEGDHIRLGLRAIRDIGPDTAQAIINGAEYGDYKSFYDFVDRVAPFVINRRTLVALISAGVFDSLGHTRQGLADVVAEIVEDRTARPEIGTEEWPRSMMLRRELDYVGMFVDQHPLDGFDELLKPFTGAPIAALHAEPAAPDADGHVAGLIDPHGPVRVAGRIDDWCRHITRQGRTWASVTLRDRTGVIEALVFPDVYERAGAWLADAALIAFRGRIERTGGTATLVVERVYDPAAEVADVLTGYGPDNYLYALTDQVMRDAPGDVLADFVPREPQDASENAVSGAVARALRGQLAVLMVQAAQAYRADLPSVDDAHIELGVRATWLPSKFFYSLARKMSGVLWPNYTGEQRDRMSKYAAELCERHAHRWLIARDKAPKFTRAVLDALPRDVRWELSTGSTRASEHRNRATMLTAYLKTRPAEEISQADIDELLAQVNHGSPVDRPFF